MCLPSSTTLLSFYSFSNIGPMADLMSASSSYLDKNSCYNSQVYGQNYSSHCYYGNMEYLSSGVPHPSLNVPSVSLPKSSCISRYHKKEIQKTQSECIWQLTGFTVEYRFPVYTNRIPNVVCT